MNKLIKQTAVGITLALGVSGVSLADSANQGCALDTLDGLYIFTASGYNIVAGVAQPKAIVEVIRFNGDGTLTVPAATHSINGQVAQSPPARWATTPHSVTQGYTELTPTEFYKLILAADMGVNYYARENNPHSSQY